MKTIKGKIIFITLLTVICFCTLITLLSFRLNKYHRSIVESQCRWQIEEEKDAVNRAIEQIQHNSAELALMGKIYFDFSDRSQRLGELAVKRSLQSNRSAIGGGIWFKPYAISPDKKNVCFYTYKKNGKMVYDPAFESDTYDYFNQKWYKTIITELENGDDFVWTSPYVDEAGSKSLMTTIGCGIHSENGELVGVSTVDFNLDKIINSISALKPTDNSFILIADVQNDYVMALSEKSIRQGRTGESLGEYTWLNAVIKGEPGITVNGVKYLSFTQILNENLLFSVNVPKNELFEDINRLQLILLTSVYLVTLLVFVLMYFVLSRLLNRPIAYLVEKSREIGRGNLDTEIELNTGDELSVLAGAFGSMTANIKEYIKNINLMTAEKERLSAELDVAREIQSSMLPPIHPDFSSYDEFKLDAVMIPSREVGGDFYDFFFIDDENLCIAIGDVSGKGIPAALFMVVAKTLIKDYASQKLSPAEIFTKVNRLLCEGNGANMFVTSLLGILNLKTGLFTYVNAGHLSPAVKQGSDCFEFLKMSPGMVLAMIDDIVYEEGIINLNDGDMLFLYTDGVTEANNPSDDMFTESRLLKIINNLKESGFAEIIKGIKTEIEVFSGEAPQFDDVTMLLLGYKLK